MIEIKATATDHARIYPSLGEFVGKFLAYAYARQVTDTTDAVWCPKWWLHAEAMQRLTALWVAFEALHCDTAGPLAASQWWRDHADLHMPRLLDPTGPFRFCGGRRHTEWLTPLHSDEMPESLFAPTIPAVAA